MLWTYDSHLRPATASARKPSLSHCRQLTGLDAQSLAHFARHGGTATTFARELIPLVRAVPNVSLFYGLFPSEKVAVLA
jgi:hypothetical protein